jgi:hypothetical protein
MSQYATINIDAYTDADYQQTFRVRTGTDEDYIDFTGSKLHLMVRRRADDVEVFLYLNSLDEDGLTTGQSGIWIYDPGGLGMIEFMVKLTHIDLQEIPQGEYVQSLIMERPDGVLFDLWRGLFSNSPGPTRYDTDNSY